MASLSRHRVMNTLAPGRVSLRGGPLRERFDRNRDRLVAIPSDGLLKRYRERRNLPAPGEYLSGWDRGGGFCGGGGKFLGPWLSAACHICAWDNDVVFRDKLDRVLQELKKCAEGDGYLSTDDPDSFRTGTGSFIRFERLLGGLLDAYCLTGDGELLRIAAGTADRYQAFVDVLDDHEVALKLTDVRNDEAYAGVENIVRLFEATGEDRYLDLARRLEIRTLRDALARNQDAITGLHACSHNLLFAGYARLYEISGESAYRAAAANAWEMIKRRSYVTGSSCDGHTPDGQEGWRGVDETPLNDQTQETCETRNWIRHSLYMLRLTGDAQYADAVERALYNALLPAQGPGRGDWAYWLPLQDRAQMIFGHCWNDPNFRVADRLCGQYFCCDALGSIALAEVPRWLFLEDAEGLVVSLFSAASAVWESDAGQVQVNVETSYPWSDEIHIDVAVSSPMRMNLRLRLPAWLDRDPRLEVNGVGVRASLARGAFASIDREWRGGDSVTLRLPMDLHSERLSSDQGRVALLYGPLVLAGLLSPKSDLRLPGEPDEAAQWLESVPDRPATFLASRHLHFRPLLTVTCEPYNVYFLSPTLG